VTKPRQYSCDNVNILTVPHIVFILPKIAQDKLYLAAKSFCVSPRSKKPAVPSPNNSSDSLFNIDSLREVVSIVERLKKDKSVSKNKESHNPRKSSNNPTSAKKTKT
jgi:hypothetical protein